MQWIAMLASLYGSVALVTSISTIVYSLRSKPRNREVLDGAGRALLVFTGVMAGLFWVLLLPIFLPGWWRERGPGAWAARRARRAEAATEGVTPLFPRGSHRSYARTRHS